MHISHAANVERHPRPMRKRVLLIADSLGSSLSRAKEESLKSTPAQVLAGMESGITQVASVPGGSDSAMVWNFPIDLTFKSTNVYGWPQLVIGVHGNDFLNRHVVK
jgi:hypothetical protein